MVSILEIGVLCLQITNFLVMEALRSGGERIVCREKVSACKIIYSKNASKMMWVAEAGHIFYLFSISLYLLFYSQEYLNVLYSFFVKGIFLLFCLNSVPEDNCF